MEVIGRLVVNGIDVETKNNNGLTPLSNAAICGEMDVVKFLVGTAGADPEARDIDSQPSLLKAACLGHLDVVKFLVDIAGVDVEIVDWNGYTPLSHSINRGYRKMIRFFEETAERGDLMWVQIPNPLHADRKTFL